MNKVIQRTDESNAFTLPAQGIQFRKTSNKQIKEYATRANPYARDNTTHADRIKTAAIAGRGPFNPKDL